MIIMEINAPAMIPWLPSLNLSADGEALLIDCARESRPLIIGWAGEDFLGFAGLIPPTFLSGEAYLWFHHAPAVLDHPIAVIRAAKAFVAQMRQRYPRIISHCVSPSSRRLVASFGAKVDGDTFEIMSWPTH